jgi:hypothetical protein
MKIEGVWLRDGLRLARSNPLARLFCGIFPSLNPTSVVFASKPAIHGNRSSTAILG